VKSVWSLRSPSSGYSCAIGSFTLQTRSAADHTSSAESRILAPVLTKSASGMAEPSPAPLCTQTVCPAEVSSRTPAGVSATRHSSVFTSLGTPMITRYSSMLLITCLTRV
jgi:hypothetical protein